MARLLDECGVVTNREHNHARYEHHHEADLYAYHQIPIWGYPPRD